MYHAFGFVGPYNGEAGCRLCLGGCSFWELIVVRV